MNNHRPSSVGSISPRSCDGWSQGSDSHSSPSHATQSPVYHDSVDSDGLCAALANTSAHNGKTSQSATKSNIIHTSPARRKKGEHSPKKNQSSSQQPQQQSSVCRTTPSSSHIVEDCRVSVDGQPGTVKWIGYECSKASRYFAGVKMVSSIGRCVSGLMRTFLGVKLIVKISISATH